MRLMENYLLRGQIVVADNWFTSMKLAEALLANDTGYIGTIKRGRLGMPADFFIKKNALSRGEYNIFQNEKQKSITATRWCDRNVVFFLSSVNNPVEAVTVKRYVGNGEKKDVPAPRVVADYQRYMRGVDRLDQQINSLRPGAKTNRYSIPIIWAIINIAIHNAYVLHCMTAARLLIKPLSNIAFRIKLAKQLINNYIGNRRYRPPPPVVPPAIDHQIAYRSSKRDCRICLAKNGGEKRIRTNYKCAVCQVYVCILCYDDHRHQA